MKKPYKVMFINLGGVLVLSLIFSLVFQMADVFLIALGTVSLVVAVANLFIGLICTLVGSKEWSKAFYLSAGVLFLLGVGVCGPMLAYAY